MWLGLKASKLSFVQLHDKFSMKCFLSEVHFKRLTFASRYFVLASSDFFPSHIFFFAFFPLAGAAVMFCLSQASNDVVLKLQDMP